MKAKLVAIETSKDYLDIVNFHGYEIAISLKPKSGGPPTGKVPRYITILGARERPKVELPFGQWEKEGSEWETIQRMLKEIHPLETLKKLKGNWQKRAEEEVLPLSLKLIKRKIEERYVIAEIDFGCEATVEDVYSKKHELSKTVRETLVRARGEKSKSVAVI
ncbi:MAG: hypothetical protein GTN36_00305 [Candidatus Aenigmarchaeota archaeon]|nr:hypothetical protein [Candidatus Aenigmarchaeota archaeon]